jgi:hypothetical protein
MCCIMALHGRKVQEPNYKSETAEGWAIPGPLVVRVVLLLLQTR